MSFRLHSIDTRADLAETLADTVAEALAAAIEARDKAIIAVSGGSTPKAFFEALSARKLDWDKVTITLVDERYVPANNPRSNHLLLTEHLLKDEACSATVLALYKDGIPAEEAARLGTSQAEHLGHPFDVVVLGMGADGHTASFFPGGDRLGEALDASGPRQVMTMEAEGAGEPRLTFSFSALHDARLLVLHIEGEEKKSVLDTAIAGGDEADMPIRAVLNRAATPVDIYWAP